MLLIKVKNPVFQLPAVLTETRLKAFMRMNDATETTNTWPHGLNLGSRESPNWTTAKTLWLETWTPVVKMMSSGMDLHFFQKRTWDAMKHLWISWKRISMEFMGPCGFKIWITCSCFKVSAVPTSTASGNNNYESSQEAAERAFLSYPFIYSSHEKHRKNTSSNCQHFQGVKRPAITSFKFFSSQLHLGLSLDHRIHWARWFIEDMWHLCASLLLCPASLWWFQRFENTLDHQTNGIFEVAGPRGSDRQFNSCCNNLVELCLPCLLNVPTCECFTRTFARPSQWGNPFPKRRLV